MPERDEGLGREIEESAQGPRNARGDSGSIEQHSLPDLIQADLHLANKRAARSRNLGLRRLKLIPPGAAGVDFKDRRF